MKKEKWIKPSVIKDFPVNETRLNLWRIPCRCGENSHYALLVVYKLIRLLVSSTSFSLFLLQAKRKKYWIKIDEINIYIVNCKPQFVFIKIKIKKRTKSLPTSLSSPTLQLFPSLSLLSLTSAFHTFISCG